jgi:hypothetical protein
MAHRSVESTEELRSPAEIASGQAPILSATRSFLGPGVRDGGLFSDA